VGVLCELYAAPHPHAQETNIANIAHVVKISYPTSKWTQKHNANNKYNPTLKQTSGRLEISTSHKEKPKLYTYSAKEKVLHNQTATCSKRRT
jgi:hypothetical protein